MPETRWGKVEQGCRAKALQVSSDPGESHGGTQDVAFSQTCRWDTKPYASAVGGYPCSVAGFGSVLIPRSEIHSIMECIIS